jgi:hypothetical protein
MANGFPAVISGHFFGLTNPSMKKRGAKSLRLASRTRLALVGARFALKRKSFAGSPLVSNFVSSMTRFLVPTGRKPWEQRPERARFRNVTFVECLGAHLKRRMTEQHPSLKKTLDDVAFLAQRRSFVTAAKRLGELRIAEERHMNLEEKTLFPIIERLAGATKALAEGKAEHATIRRLLDAVSDALRAQALPEFMSAHRKLLAALSEHWQNEERLLGCQLKVPDEETFEEIASALRRC